MEEPTRGQWSQTLYSHAGCLSRIVKVSWPELRGQRGALHPDLPLLVAPESNSIQFIHSACKFGDPASFD